MCIASCLEVCTYWAAQGAEGSSKPGRAEGTEQELCRDLYTEKHQAPRQFQGEDCQKIWICERILVDLLLKDDIHRGWGRWVPQKRVGLYRNNVLQKRKCFTKQATFYFVVHVKIFCWCPCFCRPKVQRTIKSPKAAASTEDTVSEQGKAQVDAPCLASSVAWASDSSWEPTAFPSADFREQGRLKFHVFAEGCELYSQTEPALALHSSWGASCRTSCRLRPTLGPQTNQSWQLLPDLQYFHSRAGIIIINIIFLQPHKS